MKIALVHYHLQPGGVTRVIENTILAWELNKSAPDQYVVLTGREYPGKILKNVKRVEGLDYAELEDAIEPTVLKEKLENAARNALGSLPDVWHIHNHSLGKNPALTGAVAELAQSGARILLQPHDFAEDGRPNNFSNLGSTKTRLYPTAPQIHYAALNQRDQSFLQYTLGETSSPVHLLANAIPEAPQPTFKDGKALRDVPENLYLYPVRAVRRKNLGELALLSLAYPEFHFANSLGPTNPNFQSVYDSWIKFGQELGTQLTYGLGEQTEASFPELVQQAQSLINVSVAEGFGLGFLEPWTFGQSLCGRNLPEITSDFTELGVNLDHLYNEILIDPSLIEPDALKSAISVALEKTYCQYGRSLPENGVQQAFESISTPQGIKFGHLDENLQRSAIEKAKRSDLILQDIRKQAKLGVLEAEHIQNNRSAVTQNFSLEVYGQKVFRIYKEIEQSPTTTIEFSDNERMVNKFLNPQRLNLLRV
ncbi:MAG: glycosyltransferase family 1 protein [Opitutae bacterium]|nr:glycosyltransferase family 1 protein [Opitutae bacterium]